MPKPPSVRFGLVDYKLPNGKVVQIPRAFLDRVRFDLSVSNQRDIRAEDMLGMTFGAGIRGRKGAYRGDLKYGAYAGLEPFLDRVKVGYSGQGRALAATAPYQKLTGLVKQRAMQRAARRSFIEERTALFEEEKGRAPTLGERSRTGTPARIIKQTASGEILSDTGKAVTSRDIRVQSYRAERGEKKIQGAMMKDLQAFKKIGRSVTMSNVPVNVTRSEDPNIRSSMAKHLGKIEDLTPPDLEPVVAE